MMIRVMIGLLLLGGSSTVAMAQDDASLTHCAQVQPAVQRLLDDASARLEAARQTNDATALRSAVDDLDATLRDVRAQLAPCAKVQPPIDPHVGHTMPAAVGAVTAQSNETQKIEEWLKGYDVAFLAKDLDKLATFYHPDVTIYEGAGVNNGWGDYRDHHLGPELKAFDNLEFGHTNRRVHMLGDRAAVAISEYFIKAKMKDRTLDNVGRETLVLERQPDGGWNIRHSHTSGRARPQPK